MAPFLGVDCIGKLAFDWIWKFQGEEKAKMEKDQPFGLCIGHKA